MFLTAMKSLEPLTGSNSVMYKRLKNPEHSSICLILHKHLRVFLIEFPFDRQRWGIWSTGSTMKSLLINFPLLNEGTMWIIIHLSQSRTSQTIMESGKWERESFNTGIHMKWVLEYIPVLFHYCHHIMYCIFSMFLMLHTCDYIYWKILHPHVIPDFNH